MIHASRKLGGGWEVKAGFDVLFESADEKGAKTVVDLMEVAIRRGDRCIDVRGKDG